MCPGGFVDPKNPTEAELNNQLYCLHEVFYPRDPWNNPGPFSSTQTRELLLFLQAAKDARLLKLREEIIETRRFEPFPAIGSLSEEELSLWRVAAQRRGARDLKDATWSVLMHMRTRFPHAQITPYGGGLPFCTVVAERGVVATEGNVAPSVMLKFMVQYDTACLVVASEHLVESARWPRSFERTGKLSLKWLIIRPRAFAMLRNRFEQEERLVQEKHELLFRTMNRDGFRLGIRPMPENEPGSLEEDDDPWQED